MRDSQVRIIKPNRSLVLYADQTEAHDIFYPGLWRIFIGKPSARALSRGLAFQTRPDGMRRYR